MGRNTHATQDCGSDVDAKPNAVRTRKTKSAPAPRHRLLKPVARPSKVWPRKAMRRPPRGTGSLDLQFDLEAA